MSSLKYTGYILGVIGGLALGFYSGMIALYSPVLKDYIIGYLEAYPYSLLGIDMPLPILFFIGPILIFLGLGILIIYRPSRNIEKVSTQQLSSLNCRYCGYHLEPETTFCSKCGKSQT